MKRLWMKYGSHTASVAILLTGFFFLAKDSVLRGPYIYDEADYMYAMSRGFGANYTDSPTLPLTEFVKIGLSRGRDASQRASLSELIRTSDDMVFYRHLHGPLYMDWLLLLKPLAADEDVMRVWSYFFPILTALLIYWGAIWLLPGGAGRIAAILGAVLFLWSFPVINSSELAPHELFVLWVVAALLALGKLMLSGEQKHWYAALALTAVAYCVLEVGFTLIAALSICGFVVRDRLKPNFRLAAISIGVFGGTVLLIWPGAIFKLSFVKIYLHMAYLAVYRKAAWGSNISVAETWWLRFVTSPVPWILLAVAVYLLITRRRSLWSPLLLPFAIYGAAIFLAIFRVNADIPRYVLPLYPAVVSIVAFTLGRWLAGFKPAVRIGAVVVICGAMAATTLQSVVERRPRPDPRRYSMLDLVRSENLSRKRLLVPQGDLPMVHYYFPETRLKGYLNESDISAALRGAPLDGVIYPGDPARYVPAAAVQ
jgi:hypothetical protein